MKLLHKLKRMETLELEDVKPLFTRPLSYVLPHYRKPCGCSGRPTEKNRTISLMHKKKHENDFVVFDKTLRGMIRSWSDTEIVKALKVTDIEEKELFNEKVTQTFVWYYCNQCDSAFKQTIRVSTDRDWKLEEFGDEVHPESGESRPQPPPNRDEEVENEIEQETLGDPINESPISSDSDEKDAVLEHMKE